MPITHPLRNVGRSDVWHLTSNYFPDVDESERFVYPPLNDPDPLDRALAERLLGVYLRMDEHQQRHIEPQDRPASGVWEMFKHEYHGELYRLLHDRDVDGLMHYMRAGFRKGIAQGVGGGENTYNQMVNSPHGEGNRLILMKDRAISLAMAIGALPYENPEQGIYGEHCGKSFRELVDLIEARLGIEIVRPSIMGIYGVALGNGLLDFKATDDAYCVHRMSALLGSRETSIAEIGGGFGGSAFQALRCGFRRYAIFDLPTVNLLQGYFLCRTFGPDNVGMFGEDADDRIIQVQPWWEFYNEKRSYDLVYNRDSLPEIPERQAVDYLNEIRRREIPFLSINQEGKALAGQPDLHQLSVNELASNSGLSARTRFPYWLRRGYVEETYDPV
ncbi:hypothetical protein [Hartmannibacter diazotrophicus]|uniref:hypothetical protein n=1 Tax=Hartmannibacter diazotrophicus TaxID=1482074 RepID=UPI0012FE116F|nr:hypothetical protein [Hartmannibacter diazotrophicus]